MPKQRIRKRMLEPNSPGRRACSVCDEEKGTKSFPGHLHGANHNARLDALFWICKVCGVSLLKKAEEVHEGGENHSNKLCEVAMVNDFNLAIIPLPQGQNTTECSIGGMKVEEAQGPSGAENKNIEGSSTDSKPNPVVISTPCQKNIYVAKPQKEISLEVEIDEEWTCNICDVTILKKCEETHKREKKHRGKVKMQPWACMICNVSLVIGCQVSHEASKKHRKNASKRSISVVPAIESHVGGPPKIVEGPPKIVEEPPTWTCTVCALTIDAAARESHEKGMKHCIKSYNLAVVEAPKEIDSPIPILLSPLELPWNWNCEVCALTMEVESRESHERGKKHRAKAGILVAEVSTVTDLPSATLLPTLRESHQGRKHRSKAGISDFQQWTYTICDVTLLSSSRVPYEGERQNISKVQLQEQPVEIPVTTSSTSVVSPILSPLTEPWRCTDCKITIEASARESHEAENRHRAKANRFPWRNFIRPVTPPPNSQQPHKKSKAYQAEKTTTKHPESLTTHERAKFQEKTNPRTKYKPLQTRKKFPESRKSDNREQ